MTEHDFQVAPPQDNEHVAPGCEQFSSQDGGAQSEALSGPSSGAPAANPPGHDFLRNAEGAALTLVPPRAVLDSGPQALFGLSGTPAAANPVRASSPLPPIFKYGPDPLSVSAQRAASAAKQAENPAAERPMSRSEAQELNRQHQFQMLAEVHGMLRMICQAMFQPAAAPEPPAAPEAPDMPDDALYTGDPAQVEA